MFAFCYLLLIVVLVLFSWIGSIYGLSLPDGAVLPNLLSEESIRWFARHSTSNISAAPLAEVLLVLIMVGALRSSGLLTALIHRETLVVRRHRHALYTALIAFVACACVVLVGILPGGRLLSVTGRIAGGPFAAGWLSLLTLAVSTPSIVYGWMCGQWNTSKELLAGLVSEITSCASYFITLVVASQLVAVMQYIRMFELIGMSSIGQTLFIASVYTIPLCIMFVTNKTVNGPSTIE